MGKGRAVVVEVAGKRAVVLDESGLFRRVAAAGKGWRAGDEVWMDLPAAAAGAGRRPWGARSRWAVAAAICALLIVAVPLSREVTVSAQTAAIVTFDVNPSVQLDLNRAGRVLRAVALDAGGAQLLQGPRLRGMTLSTAVGELTDRATAQGYVNETTTMPVMLAVAPATGGSLPPAITAQEAAARAEAVQHLQKKGYKVGVDALAAGRSDADRAKALHLSLGRYLVYQAAQRAGVRVTPAAMRARSIVAALRHAGASEAAIQQVLARVGEYTLPAREAESREPGGSSPGPSGKEQQGSHARGTGQPASAPESYGAAAPAVTPSASVTGSRRGSGTVRTATASPSDQAAAGKQPARGESESGHAGTDSGHGKKVGGQARSAGRGTSLTQQVWQDLQRFFEGRWGRSRGKHEGQSDPWLRSSWTDSRQVTRAPQSPRRGGGH